MIGGTSAAPCPAGTKLLGGGATVGFIGTERGAIKRSAPDAANNAWIADAIITEKGSGGISITAYAICGA